MIAAAASATSATPRGSYASDIRWTLQALDRSHDLFEAYVTDMIRYDHRGLDVWSEAKGQARDAVRLMDHARRTGAAAGVPSRELEDLERVGSGLQDALDGLGRTSAPTLCDTQVMSGVLKALDAAIWTIRN